MVAVLLVDIVIFIGLAFLAWHFGKWWIILFYPLLVFTCKERGEDDVKKDGVQNSADGVEQDRNV